MNFCVTGGAGFIGSHLVIKLVEMGHRVLVIDNLATGSLSRLVSVLDSVEFWGQDISKSAGPLAARLRGTDCVFHLAAVPSVMASIADPLGTHASCALSTLVLLEAMREAGVPRIVYSSSCAVYGQQPTLPWNPGLLPRPMSPYAAQKLAGEHYAEVYHALYGISAVSLRYFNVYGPGQPANSDYAAVVPRFVMAVRASQPATIFGDGRQTRDFIHVTDVVRANLMAADYQGLAVLDVASGREMSILALLEAIRRIGPKGPEPIFLAARPGEIVRSVGDPRPAKETLGFQAQIPLEEGLQGLLGVERAG